MRWGMFLIVLALAPVAVAEVDGGTPEVPQVQKPNNGNDQAGRSPRKIQRREECKVGEDCVLPDGTVFRVNQGPTPRLNKVVKKTTEHERRLDDLEEQLKREREERERLESLAAEINGSAGEEDGHNPFRVGGSMIGFNNLGGALFGAQFQPNSGRLQFIAGINGGVAYMADVPTATKGRAMWDVNLSLNYPVGPGRAFVGTVLTGSSNLFDNTQKPFDYPLLGFGPTAGYRYPIGPVSVDFALAVPYGQIAWTSSQRGWQPYANLGVMWEFGGINGSSVADKSVKGEGKIAKR